MEEISIIHQQFFADNTFIYDYHICTVMAFSVWGEKRSWNLIPGGMKYVW